MKQISGLSSPNQRSFIINWLNPFRVYHHAFRSLLVFFCFHFLGGQFIYGQWSSDPAVNTPIVDGTFIGGYGHQVLSNADGSTIIAWADERSGNSMDIYAQRVNARGVVEWAVNGVAVCAVPKDQGSPRMTSDGEGGAIIVWTDYRPSATPANASPTDIYAQRINAKGELMWAASGVPVCTAPGDQSANDIVSDGKGGVIITWHDYRAGAHTIYIQYLNADGTPKWAENGIAVCPGSTGYWPTLILTEAGNSIVTWSDERYEGAVFAQMFNASGAAQWMADGVLVCNAAKNQYFTSIVSDGEQGAIVSWLDTRKNERVEIYAQRINSKGETQWPMEGLRIASKVSQQRKPPMISDGSGGAIFTWDDHRNGNNIIDVYAQRVSVSGDIMWTPGGVPICTTLNRQHWSTPVPDGSGGAIITWEDRDLNEPASSNDIYAQRIDATGNILWTPNGVVISAADGDQVFPTLTPYRKGGAVISWTDYRNRDSNIDPANLYAQNINSNGIPGCILPVITQQPLISQTISQDSIPEDLVVTVPGNDIGYQWFSNTIASVVGATSLSAAGTGPAFTPPTAIPGTLYYFCRVTGNCDTLYSDMAEVTIKTSTSPPMPDPVSNLEIIVTPNPTQAAFNIMIRSPLAEALELRVLDMSGRIMEYRQGYPGEAFWLGEKFAAGMYIIDVRQAGQKAIKKAIKQ